MKRVLFHFCFIFIVLYSCKTIEKTDETVGVKTDSLSISAEQKDVHEKEEVDGRFCFVLKEIPKDSLDEKISGLFTAIEEKIIKGDFEGWYNALSAKYKKILNNKETLKEMSKDSDYLYSRKIILSDPKDYFLHIVVPSRQGATLKYVSFEQVDEGVLKVNCILDGKWNFVYHFVYEDNSWKLDRK